MIAAPPTSGIPQPAPVPRLLVELPSWPRVFFGNLRDLVFLRGPAQIELQSAPAPFWPDVFVTGGLPWRSFLDSGACHFIALALVIGLTRFFALQPKAVPVTTFDHSQVVYYLPAEYLPPLDTRASNPGHPEKADPELSRQPIISVPPEADNSTQTIVAAPNVKLNHDVPLPNIVAWNENDRMQKPRLDIPAVPVTPAAEITRIAPQMASVVAPPPDPADLARRRDHPILQNSVVAPPPDVGHLAAAFQGPQLDVIAPPPSIEASARRLGDLNIRRSSIIAPAPQLALREQRVIAGLSAPGVTPLVVAPPPSLSASASSRSPAGSRGRVIAAQVVAPPPSFSASASPGSAAGSRGRVIALNRYPVVGAPPDPPSGNRRGAFAATPEGHPGASGSPGSTSADTAAGPEGRGHGSSKENGSGSSSKGAGDLPTGLYVGSAAPASTSAVTGDPRARTGPADPAKPNLASVHPPRVTGTNPMQPGSAATLSDVERAVFADRKFYSLTLNMPNLNSAGGSWIVRFAELNHDSAQHLSDSPAAELSQPSAIRKVDPAYPLQLMRENVAGTVILYAIIHADGAVGNVRVLRGVDDRLDRFASRAVAQWQFHPATKNGSPVDVEATFQIPFHPSRVGTNF